MPENNSTSRNDHSWDVVEISLDYTSVMGFFRNVGGVPTPKPHDYDTLYAVQDDDENPVGMAVVDTFTRPLLFAVAVLPDYQQQGIGTALVKHCMSEQNRLYCRVKKTNNASIAMCERAGLEQHESMWPEELWQYEAPNQET